MRSAYEVSKADVPAQHESTRILIAVGVGVCLTLAVGTLAVIEFGGAGASGGALQKGAAAPPPPPGVDCVGAWSAYGQCSATCQGPDHAAATQGAVFTISVEANHGGTQCQTYNRNTRQRPCNPQPAECKAQVLDPPPPAPWVQLKGKSCKHFHEFDTLKDAEHQCENLDTVVHVCGGIMDQGCDMSGKYFLCKYENGTITLDADAMGGSTTGSSTDCIFTKKGVSTPPMGGDPGVKDPSGQAGPPPTPDVATGKPGSGR